MKREDVRSIFPAATDDEVTAILNEMGKELNPLKSRLKDAEAERDAASAALAAEQAQSAELKGKLDEAQAAVEQKMTAEERLEALERAAADREREFSLKSNGLDAKEIFVAAGCFDAEEVDGLVEQVVGEDAEQTRARAQRIVDTVVRQREAVEKATRDALLKANPNPQGGGGGEGTPATMADFLKLPYDQQLALKEANPAILSQLK